MINKKYLAVIILFFLAFASIAHYYMKHYSKIADIKEIPALFKSGAYDINNDKDLRKLAKRLTPEQIAALAKDIEENPYTYYDQEKTAILIIAHSALYFYTIAAEQGSPEMQYKIATFHLDLGNLGIGIDLPKDDLPWLDAETITFSAKRFAADWPKDDLPWIDAKTGKNWLQLAFENNYPKAIERIVYYCLPNRSGSYFAETFYYESRNLVEQTMPLDMEHCKEYVEKAYNQKIAAPYEVAIISYYAKDYKNAVKYIEESLEYFKTEEFKKEDEYWQEDYRAFINYLIGNLYYYGYEYPQDYKKAMQYYTKAEEESYGIINYQAYIKMVYMYKNGLGVKKKLLKFDGICYHDSEGNPILDEGAQECRQLEQD